MIDKKKDSISYHITHENCTTCYLAANRTEEQSTIFQASFSGENLFL